MASWYPTVASPVFGIFVRRQIAATRDTCDVALVVADHDPIAIDGIPMVSLPRPSPSRGTLWRQTIDNPIIRGHSAVNRTCAARTNIDVVHLHEFHPLCGLACTTAWSKRVPLVISLHSSNYHRKIGKPGAVGWLDRGLQRTIMRRADAIIVPSTAMADDVHNFTGVDPVVMSNVVNTSVFRPVPGAHQPDNPVFAHTSSLDIATKNIIGLIDAFADAAIPGSTLVLIGSGNDSNRIDAHIRRIGLERRVRMVGMKTPHQIAAIYARSTAFLLASPYETFNVAAAEALSSGIPVVTTPCGGPDAYMTPETGIVADITEFPNAIRDVCERRYNRDALHAHIDRRCSPSAVGKMLTALYREVSDVT